MTKYPPELTPLQFHRITTAPSDNFERVHEPGLQEGAWLTGNGDYMHIHIPWSRALSFHGGRVIRSHDTHHKVLKHICPVHDSILDVGGFDGIWAWLFAAEEKLILDTCCEALERWAIIHADIICADAGEIGGLFEEDEFDLILIMDALEHMEEESAYATIVAAEEIAKHQVIIAVPDGWVDFPVDGPQWGLIPADIPCREGMAHRSGWSKKFFEDRGYEILVQSKLHEGIGGGDGLVCFYNKWEM